MSKNHDLRIEQMIVIVAYIKNVSPFIKVK